MKMKCLTLAAGALAVAGAVMAPTSGADIGNASIKAAPLPQDETCITVDGKTYCTDDNDIPTPPSPSCVPSEYGCRP
jgi:hypothetical protein